MEPRVLDCATVAALAAAGPLPAPLLPPGELGPMACDAEEDCALLEELRLGDFRCCDAPGGRRVCVDVGKPWSGALGHCGGCGLACGIDRPECCPSGGEYYCAPAGTCSHARDPLAPFAAA